MEGSNVVLPVDMVIVAVGLAPNPLISSLTAGLQATADGELVVDDDLMTTKRGVFAGGDIVGGETVIQAMGMGKQAARSIWTYLFDKKVEY
jgi:glutamate synthase (NADPH/NADH) small chain